MLVISSTYQDNAKALIKLILLVARLTATKVKVLSICATAEASSSLLASSSYVLALLSAISSLFTLGGCWGAPISTFGAGGGLACLPWLEPP
jgi:hypothetical protein